MTPSPALPREGQPEIPSQVRDHLVSPVPCLRPSVSEAQQPQTFEQWRVTQPWYVVSKPDPDDDQYADTVCIHRMMNLAAHEAWDAALAQASTGADTEPHGSDELNSACAPGESADPQSQGDKA